jgi:hypothetical protein
MHRHHWCCKHGNHQGHWITQEAIISYQEEAIKRQLTTMTISTNKKWQKLLCM